MSKTNFVDGDPSQGITGTIVTAAFLNAINNHRHRGLAEDGDGAIDYAADTGSANACAIALVPALTAHVVGMPIHFKVAATNTGAATLAVNSLAAVAIRKNVSEDLTGGDMKSGQIVTVIYEGTCYQLQSIAMEGILIAVDEKTSGTNSGTFTASAWRTRDLNTVRTNTISGASLTNNQITLPAGKYQVIAYLPAYQVWQHKGKLKNITDALDIIVGSSEACHAGGITNTCSIIIGQFTITSQKVFELQHYCAVTAAGSGFGPPSGIADTAEVYTQVKIRKIA
jgi:hypothetical protein